MASTGGEGRARPEGRRTFGLVAVAVGVTLVAGVAAWRFAGGDEIAAPPSTSVAPSIAVADVAPDSSVPIESRLPWPDPPADHEPHVLTSPGDGPLVSKPDGLRLLYVNSIGRLTLLDLATGDRTEIEVADTRAHDTIALEPDGVRSLTRRMNVQLAGPSAVVVHLHRPTVLTGWSLGSEPGLHVCLTTDCVASGRYDRLVVDAEPWPAPSVTFEPLRSAGRPDLVELITGDGEVTGRFRTVDTSAGPARVPEPIGGEIWLMTDTGADVAGAEV